MKRPLRIALWISAILAGLVVVLLIAGVLVLRSDWFREKVRARIVTEVEKATGGKAEVGAFRFDWRPMQASVGSFTLHGTEPAGEAPLFHAESVSVGLKIISVFRRKVDIASLTVDQPRLHVTVSEDGSTNFPSPKTKRSGKDPIQTLLDLAVDEFHLTRGTVDYDSRTIPLEAHGDNLEVKLAYEAALPRYTGDVSLQKIHLRLPSVEPLDASTRFSVSLERNRLTVADAVVRLQESEIRLSGTVTDFKHPQGLFDTHARATMAELAPKLHLPLERRGSLVLIGKASFGGAQPYGFEGKLTGTGLAIHRGVRIDAIGLRGDVHLEPKELEVKGLRVSALGGSFAGGARIQEFDRFQVTGNVRGFALEQLAAAGRVKRFAWNGTAAGPVKVQGSLRRKEELVAEARVAIAPAAGPLPVKGAAEVRYIARGERVELGHTWIETPNSRVDATGTLGRSVEAEVRSTNLDDFLPAIAMFSATPPEKFPVTLASGGTFHFRGNVSGPLANPTVAGNTTLTNFQVEGQALSHFEAGFQINRQSLAADTFTVARGQTTAHGSLRLGLSDWKPVDASPLEAAVSIDNADLHELLAENKQDLPIEGMASAKLEVSGSLGAPSGGGSLTVARPVIYGQPLDRIRAELKLGGTRAEVVNGRAELGSSVLVLNATYDHTGTDWKNGTARFAVSSKGFNLEQFRAVREAREDLRGVASLQAAGTVRVVNARPELANLNGQVALSNVLLGEWKAGNLMVTGQTQGDTLNLHTRMELDGSAPIDGKATVRLAGDYPASGQLSMPRLDIVTVNHVRRATGSAANLPFSGAIVGNASFSGPLRKREELKGRVSFSSVRITPAEQAAFTSDVRRDLTVVNNGPVEITLDAKGARIQHAEFTARDTKVAASGLVGFQAGSAWDLRVSGSLNLAIARSFYDNLRTEGRSKFNIAIRGPIRDPQVTGQMELKDASFNYADVPNGISDANGTVVFDRNRATISSLTGKSGGGDVALSGFVGFGTGTVLYRLAAKASNVRVRYPEGTSTTVSAQLNLTGTSDQSLISGNIAVERVGFRPKTDVGGLLAAAMPVNTPSAPNDTLRNMQLDVRIQTSANAEFSTSYTQDVRAEADLRLRGNVARPSLLGRVNIIQGQVLFFGNKYSINRGDVSFYNPSRIEPVLDLNLQTDVRGVTVTINFSGTLQRLNMTYRSDPPLQTQEIVALLAVGRAPTAGSGLASGQTVTTGNVLNTGANTLLGQAVATPVSNRLQRFFGVSRLKIDPLLQGTSVDTTPQAKLTLEQQISPKVTLTYVTNVTKSQQQLVRLQWDVNRQWSVVAIRDENGIFGIDFQYKRRF